MNNQNNGNSNNNFNNKNDQQKPNINKLEKKENFNSKPTFKKVSFNPNKVIKKTSIKNSTNTKNKIIALNKQNSNSKKVDEAIFSEFNNVEAIENQLLKTNKTNQNSGTNRMENTKTMHTNEDQKNSNLIDIKKIPDEEKIDYQGFKKYTISNQFRNETDKTYIFAVGGLDEVGKNSYVIEHNDETIMVDYGIKFASSDLLGINGIIANTSYFSENNRPIDHLFITHGHEDHIGGIPYIVQHADVKKIYAPPLAAELIIRRLSEFKEINNPPEIVVFDDNSKFVTKYFEVDFFRVCHSIPDCYGLFIKTPNGNIMSAGDYRFDFGKDTDDTNIHKIIEMSNRKVDIFLAESTNSDQPGFSETEDNIIDNVSVLIKNAKGRVFVATFASNLGRIEKIIERAINLNRKICIMGRSMEANIKTSRKLGYLKLDETDFITAKEISSHRDNEVLVILTGSQGEEMAALNLMSENKYQKIVLKPSDTIIMSSNPIPGNFKSVDNLINKLFKLGVNVVQNTNNYKIHSSGHATKQEQQMMVKIINPKYIVPIHGESKMLKSMKQNSVEIGWNSENIFILTNGLKVELFKNELKMTDQLVDARPLYIDKKNSSLGITELLDKRKSLSEEGIFNVLLLFDKQTNKLSKNPMLATRGCFYAKDSSSLISKISFSIKEEIDKYVSNTNETINEQKINEIVSKSVKFFVWKNKKKNPIVTTTIFYL